MCVFDVFYVDDFVVGEFEWECCDVVDGVYVIGRDVRVRSAESRVYFDFIYVFFGGV